MAEQQKRFEPWTVFAEACWKLRKAPPPASLGFTGNPGNEREVNAWFRDNGINVLYSRKRNEYTVAIECDPMPAVKDAVTGDMVYPLQLAVTPTLQGKPYIRILAKRPLTRPYDLATVLDAQGAELQPFFSTPREDIVMRDTGYTIPAGSAEWYGGSGLAVLAASARGRLTADVVTAQESEGKFYLRFQRWCDTTIPMLGAKFGTSKGVAEISSLLGQASVFVERFKKLFELVELDYGLAQAGETESKYLLRLRRERIEDRKVQRPQAQQFAPEETEAPEVPEDLGTEAAEQGKAEAEPKPDEVKRATAKPKAKAKGNGNAAEAPTPAAQPDAGSLPADVRDALKAKGARVTKLKGKSKPTTNPAGE